MPSSEAVADAIDEATRCYGAGRPDLADTLCQQILRDTPDCAAALNLLGAMAMDSDTSEGAVEFFKAAIQSDPGLESAYNNLRLAWVSAGELEQARMFFESAAAKEPENAALHFELGQVLVETGDLQGARYHYQTTLQLRPNIALVHHLLGNVLRDQGIHNEAEQHFRAAVRIAPHYLQAHTSLANLLADHNHNELALEHYQQAVALAPNRSDVHCNLGNCLNQLGRSAAAVASYDRSLAVDAEYSKAHINRAIAILNMGLIDEAIAAFRRALVSEPGHVLATYNLSMLQLMSGDFREGLPNYEWRRLASTWRSLSPDSSAPEWNGEALNGKVLLIYAEQGLGDCIQFIRYASQLAADGASVIFRGHESLRALFRSAPGVALYVGPNESVPPHDYQLPIMSIAYRLGTTLQSIPSPYPYINAPQDKCSRWKQRIKTDNGLKVGIAWAGSAAHHNDRNRSIAPGVLRELITDSDITFVSLQKDATADDLSQAGLDGAIIDLSSELNDFEDTAAIIMALDVVITVDTAVAHLAGALGKPTWVMLSHIPDWRWLLARNDSPWYPGMRLFRQGADRQWPPVIKAIATALGEMRVRRN
jgi:tetratricopeptide (TPR) repeat protein